MNLNKYQIFQIRFFALLIEKNCKVVIHSQTEVNAIEKFHMKLSEVR